jgi:hypothetical protein
MLPVVSARSTMSGVGGITGVWTVLATSIVAPGAALSLTLDGTTPTTGGCAAAGTTMANNDRAMAAINEMRRNESIGPS